MKKEEILFKVQNENNKVDERDFDIEKTANLVAFITTITILAVFAIISIIQKSKGVHQIVELNILSFIFLTIISVKYFTSFYYYKENKYLFVAIIGLFGSICSAIMIVV